MRDEGTAFDKEGGGELINFVIQKRTIELKAWVSIKNIPPISNTVVPR